MIEGATGVKWSEDVYEPIGPIDVGSDFVQHDPDVFAVSMELLNDEEPDEVDFEHDQGILDHLDLPCVPYTQDVTASQVAGLPAPIAIAGQTDAEAIKAAEDTAKAEAANATRNYQAVMAAGLKR